jgi:hypothetical protein
MRGILPQRGDSSLIGRNELRMLAVGTALRCAVLATEATRAAALLSRRGSECTAYGQEVSRDDEANYALDSRWNGCCAMLGGILRGGTVECRERCWRASLPGAHDNCRLPNRLDRCALDCAADAFSDASILREIHSHRHRNFGNLLGCVLPLLDLGTPEVRNANRLLVGVALVVLGIFCDAGSIRQYCCL